MSDEARFESAVYEIRELNRSALTTKVNVVEHQYKQKEFDAIKRNLFKKSEVFKVELVDYDRTILIYHFDTIGADEIKVFVLPYKDEIEIMESEVFTL